MTRRIRRALVLAALLAVVAGTAVGLRAAGGWTGTSAPRGADLAWLLSFLAFPLVGALVAWHRPELTVGWVYLAVGLAQVGAALASLVAEHQVAVAPGGALADWASLVENLGFAVSWVLATTYALLCFPVDLPWRRSLLMISGIGLAALLGGYSLASGHLDEDLRRESPLAVAAWGEWPRRVGDAGYVALLAVALAALVGLVVAWWRSRGESRTRLMWLGLGALVALITAVGGTLLSPWSPGWVGPVSEAVAVAVLPVATGIGVLRSGLFDVEAVLDHTIVYAVLTGLVLATYFASVALATGVLGDDAARGASLLASAAVAVSLAPVKDRLHRLVDRAVYGDRARPYSVLAGLAAKLERTSALDELITTVTDTIARTLRLPYVQIHLGAAHPAPDGALALPLLTHGRQEGVMVIGARPGRSAFADDELALLRDLATQVAREVRIARLAQDLQESRERIVRAREEERLRVRRDLHDGIGPTLAAAGLQVDALRERWASDDPLVTELLGKIKQEISESVGGVRHVVDGLRPPALDDLGLAGVVREYAADLGAAGLDVEVSCPPGLRVPSAAVEVAAYRIVTEAVTNVVRHAAAGRCTVTLDLDRGWLLVEVADDGRGVGSAPAGVGTASMRERAAELGGEMTVGPRPGGGTVVRARLPVDGAGS